MTTPPDENRETLRDGLGREITYLRVSLTERCNLRCIYCDPSPPGSDDGVKTLATREIRRLIHVFSTLGVDKIRFTGGEPLVRSDVVELVAAARSVEGISIVGLTTNGTLLESRLDALVSAGLNRLNVSLDTLDPRRFERITGGSGLDRVLRAVEDAVSSGAFPRVKINTVVMRGVNDDECRGLAAWALRAGLDVRFIEFMPTRRSGWRSNRFVGEGEIRARIGMPLEPDPSTGRSNGPASTYWMPGLPGRVSFISAVSRSFCSRCNRLRVTASGDLVGCLYGVSAVPLTPILDEDDDGGRVARRILEAVCGPGFRRAPSGRSVTSRRPLMRGIGG